MRWVVLLFLASCYAPASYSSCGVTCAADVDCPTGQACFANLCSASPGQCSPILEDARRPLDIDGNPDLDSDDDGIMDSVDKCPAVSSQDNRDHDGDGLGDICDPCPMFTDNSNSDGDKIGDKCDPRPQNAADVATFYGFYDVAEYAAWDSAGNWNVTGGKLVATNLTQGGAVFFETPIAFGGNVAVYAPIEIMQINADPQLDRYAGVSARRNGAAYEGCQFGIAPTPQNTNLRVRTFNGSITDSFGPYGGMLTVGAHPIRYLALEGNNNCSVDLQTVAGGGTRVTGKVAVQAILMNVAVDWLFVVTMN